MILVYSSMLRPLVTTLRRFREGRRPAPRRDPGAGLVGLGSCGEGGVNADREGTLNLQPGTRRVVSDLNFTPLLSAVETATVMLSIWQLKLPSLSGFQPRAAESSR